MKFLHHSIFKRQKVNGERFGSITELLGRCVESKCKNRENPFGSSTREASACDGRFAIVIASYHFQASQPMKQQRGRLLLKMFDAVIKYCFLAFLSRFDSRNASSSS
jgi:hypothetical protein